MRTITEAANELNVSRKKIYNYIAKLSIDTTKNSSGNYIKDEDFVTLKEQILLSHNNGVPLDERNVPEHEKDVPERNTDNIHNLSNREYKDLKERIHFLEDQLKAKDMQLKDKDMQITGLIQSNINFSKALNPPKGDDLINIDTNSDDDNHISWIKRIFKKNNVIY
jgi:DNA-binding transcriptional MerR regulator